MGRQRLLLGLNALAALVLIGASVYAWTREDSDARAGLRSIDQVERGRTLFLSTGCAACHHLAAADIIDGFGTGPDLSRISQVAGTRVEGQSADAYIRASIVSPDSFIAPGGGGTFPMPRIALSPADLDALVAYLMAENEHSSTIGVSS